MLKRLFALSNQGAKDLNKGIAATTLSNLCLILPVSLLILIVMELLNIINGESSRLKNKIILYCVLTVLLFVIVFASQWLQYNKTYTVAYQESANRRIVLAEKLRKLPLSFFGQKDLSDLTTTIMGDCTALERVFSNAIPQLFGTIFMFIITAIGLLVMDWRLGLCIVIPVPIAALVVIAARKAQVNAESANLDAKRAAYDGVQEYLDTIQEIKSCSREEEYLEGLEKKLDNVVRCSFRNEIAPGAATTAAQFILRFGLVAVMLVGGYLVTRGTLTIPMFILFLLFAGRIYDPFTSCFMLLAEVFSALVSVNRMKQTDATPEQTGSPVCDNDGYDIEFKDVEFSYNDEPVLKGVSFVAKQGQVTALVGPSGSGKSTVSRLAARFWDADTGIITLGGVDVKTVEPETLFKNYAIVFQDVMLFDDTVMENIRLGRRDATDDEVRAAANAAQCEEFICRLPEGYQTNIGENGSALSGGERQRISIARALLKDAPVVLLDEATASMDAESETLVQAALSMLLRNKTVMVIAHRMRTIASADKIIVLDDGRIREQGKADELVRRDGLYSHLVELQRGK
ncbi:MAG: ABC transporter ATP-binding protein [Lachnospiraceae bacterium]